MKEKSLDDLIIQRNKLSELVRYAKLFGGKVKIGNELISITELQNMLSNVKADIATQISTSKLKLINPHSETN